VEREGREKLESRVARRSSKSKKKRECKMRGERLKEEIQKDR